MNKFPAGHPDEGDLLRYLEGETGAADTKAIRAHVQTCWQCQTALEETKQTISECVRYRRALHDSLPDPPAPWFNIQRQMAELDASTARPGWIQMFARTLQRMREVPSHWVAATAVLVVMGLIVDQLRNTPSVQAAELLRKAVIAADQHPAPSRRLRISTRKGQFVRVKGSAPDTLARQLEPRFQGANYSWDEPLSAHSFASWRDGLAEKRDEVTEVRDAAIPSNNWFRIRTTTASSDLVEASLKLRGEDLHAIESEFRFRDREWVKIAELEETDPTPPVATAVETAAKEPAPSLPPAAPPATIGTERPASPADELRVLAALRKLDADLGEPVEVRRRGPDVLVTGVGVSPQLRDRIEMEMRQLPRVAVRFTDPAVEPILPAEPAAPPPQPRNDALVWQTEMERRLGGRAAYDDLANQVLETSDSLMSRAHALRRLAERFPPEAEASLSSGERSVLRRLRAEHAQALAKLAIRLERQSRPGLIALGAPATRVEVPAGAARWQQATDDLFQEARHTELLLAVMLGGAAADTLPDQTPGPLLISVEKLKIRAERYADDAVE